MCSLLADVEQSSSLGKSEGKYETPPHTQRQPGMVGNSGRRDLEEHRDKEFHELFKQITNG